MIQEADALHTNNDTTNGLQFYSPESKKITGSAERCRDDSQHISKSQQDYNICEYCSQTYKSDSIPRKSLIDKGLLSESKFNDRYIGHHLKQALDNNKIVLLKSDMSTGKTTAIKNVIASLPKNSSILYTSPRKKLNKASSKDLSLNYYEDVKDSALSIQYEGAKRMSTTPQGLSTIKNVDKVEYELVIFDESQSIADLITSTITDDKRRIINALRAICEKAKHVVFMDAHLAEQTKSMLDAICTNQPYHFIENTYQRWTEFDCNIITGGNYSNRRAASDQMQIEAIERGEKIAITSSSKSYCQQRAHEISSRCPDLNILLITSENHSNTDRVLSNPALIDEYDVVIFSPSVDVGVSFDISDHFDSVFAVIPNKAGTPAVDQSIQALARIRNPKSKTIYAVLDDQGDKNIPIAPACGEISDALLRRFEDCILDDIDNHLCSIYASCFRHRQHQKNNFESEFRSRINQMGMKIHELHYDQVNPADDSYRQQFKEEQQEKSIKDRTESLRIDRETFNQIEIKKKYYPDSVSEGEKASCARFRFENWYNINCDELSSEYIDLYIDADDKNARDKIRRRELAQADNDFINQLSKARRHGIGQQESFKVDVLSNKHNIKLERKLYNHVLRLADDEYTHNSIKQSSFYRFVSEKEKDLVSLGIISLQKNWRKKPALIVKNLLESLGYEVNGRQVRTGKNHIYIWSATEDNFIAEQLERRAVSGKDWVTETSQIMKLHDNDVISKLLPRDKQLSLFMPSVDIRFIKDAIIKVPKRAREEVLLEYIDRYDMLSPKNGGIDAQQNANRWLTSVIERQQQQLVH